MKKILVLTIILSTFFCCSSNDDYNASSVKIRLSNDSEFNFSNIVVNTSTGNVSFENIDSGQVTNYKTFDIAYRYAFIQLDIEGETYILQPIDYTGETPLENGHYTYQINANDSQEQYEKLTLILIQE